MKTNPMEQIKESEKIEMITPVEGSNTHLEAHERINSAVTQFYRLFNDLINQCSLLAKIHEDAEEVNLASFSKLRNKIDELKEEIKKLNRKIDDINCTLKEGGRFLTIRYEGMVDTDSQTVVELDTIKDEDLKGRNYLANIVVDEAIPNQGTMTYSFPQTRLVHGEWKPTIFLQAKEGEHAVLEYDFRIILTEI